MKVENWGKFVKVENWGEQLSESSSFVSIKPRWVDGVEPRHKLAAVQFSLQPSSPQVREAEGPRVCQVKTQKPKIKQKTQIGSNALFFAGCPHVRERRAEGPGVSIEKPLTSKICQVLEKKDQKYQWATD